MKKINFFPFERNRYYYGKHLTVNDFILEQEYVNNKRRFINRYLHGTGVICGLNVVAIDEKTISVESGAAIDFAGREIIVDTPVIKKISSIEGFDEDDDTSSLYLCINYDEKENQPVYSVAGVSSSNQGLECNSYLENYSLHLTSRKPNIEVNTLKSFYISDKIIYQGTDFSIRHRTSLFAKSNGNLKFEVIVEKNNDSVENAVFKYSLKLTCLTFNQSDTLNIDFNESKFKKAKSYTLSFNLNVANVQDDYALIENSGQLHIFNSGQSDEYEEFSCIIKPKIVASDIEHEIMKEYYNKSMEKILKHTSYQCSIYIAKIDLIRARSTYFIESIENMPFDQYIFGGQLSGIMNDLILDKFKNTNKQTVTETISKSNSESNISSGSNYMVSSGEEIIDLGIGGKFGQIFTSDNIAHNLGLGTVSISLGCACEVSDNSALVYGSSEIFTDSSIKCETAAKLDVTTGKFKIGIRLLENTTKNKVKICWTAVKVKETEDEIHNRRVFIQPSIANLSVMQTCYFTAVFENINDNRVNWSIREINGGTINSNGMYTAPNTPGIYEITAQSEAYPNVKTSVYAIVSDLK